MIQLGEKKGTKNEPHFIIKMSVSVGNIKLKDGIEFDVYAETADEVWKLINKYFDELFLRYRFQKKQ